MSIEQHMRDNLARIQARIDDALAHYNAHSPIKTPSINLVAVSKYQSISAMRALYHAGQCIFGENRVQDLAQKVRAFNDNVDEARTHLHAPMWHFIGTLQRNKINALLALNPALIHSIDSIKLALSLNKACAMRERIQPVLLQVNAANEASKHGFMLNEAKEAFIEIKERASSLRVIGLMSIGAHSDDKTIICEGFAKTHALYEDLRARYDDVNVLSMGMSNDFCEAIMHGANMLRIGSALFTHSTNA